MSTTESAASTGVFCDTSVLLDYVLNQGNDAAKRLLTESERFVVVSETVEEEFERVPERREDVYLDFMRVVISEDTALEDQTIADREYLHPNDRSFFEQLRHDVAGADAAKDRLKRLREKQRIIDRRHGQTREIIHRILEQNDDLGLLLQLGTVVENEDDCQVLGDAVEWSHSGGSGAFATLDADDILSNSERINEVVETYHDPGAVLDIGGPDIHS